MIQTYKKICFFTKIIPVWILALSLGVLLLGYPSGAIGITLPWLLAYYL